MRFRFTIFLVLINVLTFGTILYLDRRGETETSARGELARTIAREVADADRIELRSARSNTPRVLERTGSTWRITDPEQWNANPFAVNRILNQLQFIQEEAAFSVEEMLRREQTLEDYGLANPSLELVIHGGGSSVRLALGAPTEIGNNVYLLGPDERTIYVINRAIVPEITLSLDDLRNREVFDIPVFEIEAMSLRIAQGDESGDGALKTRLVRSRNAWQFEAPLTAEADPTLVTTTLNELAAAKVIRFIEPAAVVSSAMGLDEPAMEITLHGNRRRQTLFIGNSDPAARQPAYFAKLADNPTVFTLSRATFDALREAQDALRERNFVNFEPTRVSTIEISQNDLLVRLQKLETGAWQIVESDSTGDIQTRRADPALVDDLIRRIRELRALQFTADSPTAQERARYGFETPRRTVRLRSSGEELLHLRFAHPEDENDRLFAMVNPNFIYEVPRRDTIQLLALNPIHYRDRTLERLPAAAVITRLTIEELPTEENTSPTTLFDARLDPERETWPLKLEADAIPGEQQESLITLLDQLRNLRVASFYSDRFHPENRLVVENPRPWRYSIRYEITLPGGQTSRLESRALFLSERLGGTTQAGSAEHFNVSFFLQPAFIEAFEPLTRPISEAAEDARQRRDASPIRIEPLSIPPGLPALPQ